MMFHDDFQSSFSKLDFAGLQWQCFSNACYTGNP